MDNITKEKESNFHKGRVAFIVYKDKIQYLKNSEMSHKEWCDSLGIKDIEFDNIVRGYINEERIVYYQGDFEYNQNTIDVSKNTYKQIVKDLDIVNYNVYCGVIKGEIGKPWDPIIKIADEKGEIC